MTRRFGTLTLAAAVLAACPPAARADNLDLLLNKAMPEVVKKLRDQGYKNVGVLRFQAVKGKRKPSFSAGPINANLATRLENLLIVHGGDNEANALGVTRDAGATALARKVGPWSGSAGANAAGRRKLFELNYPLAWGDKKVKPDVFLTGVVRNGGDRTKTTVALVGFNRKNPEKLFELAKVTAKTDRHLVRDLGYNFALTGKQRSALVRSRDEEALDEQADKNALEAVRNNEKNDDKDPDEKKPDDPRPDEPKPDNKAPETEATARDVGGIEVKMLVDKEPVAIEAGASQQTKYEVMCPAKGKSIAFALTNKSDKKLGVVLRVNGLNTIGLQNEEAEACRKWVIPAGKTYTIEGFYTGEKFDALRKFTVLEGEPAKTAIAALAEKAQRIEIDVFESSDAKPQNRMLVSARGLSPAAERAARGSYETLRSALMKKARLKKSPVKGRGEIIVPEEPDQGVKVAGPDVVEFGTPSAVAHLEIKVIPSTSEDN